MLNTIPVSCGTWQESGAATSYHAGRYAHCHRTTLLPGKWNLLVLHPLYAPLKGATLKASLAFLAGEIKRAKSQGWDGVIIDAEGILWTPTAIKWIYESARAAGVLCYCAPKASLDPGGKTLFARDYAKAVRFLNAFSDGLFLWAYGYHQTHIASRDRLLRNGYTKEIALIHDLFRNDKVKGYIGKTEGPKLAAWCQANAVPFISFAPNYAAALTTSTLSRFAVPPVPPVPVPVPPVPSLPYSTTANTITLRPDFAAAVTKIDVLTKINDPAFPGSTGKASSIAVQATRSGNTWTLPKALASYPKGNRVNAWRIRLVETPPSDVPYYKSISQTFVQDGAKPGIFEPKTTR